MYLIKPFLLQHFDSPKSALIAIVDHFENNQDIYHQNEILDMTQWEYCVIGLLNHKRDWQDSEEHILTKFLGLNLGGEYNNSCAYFSEKQLFWSDENWKYFKFFTSAVQSKYVYYLKDWIKDVREVLKDN